MPAPFCTAASKQEERDVSMATYYVSTNGSDNASGSSSSPWRTINKAMKANLKPGDEVVVRSGTYKESVSITKDGAPGNYITLRSEKPGGAKIIATKELGIRIDANYIEVEGFDVSGASRSGINGSRVHHVKITDNISHHNTTAGIFFKESDFLTIEGNVSHHNAASGPSSGISILHAMRLGGGDSGGGYRIILRDNKSYDNITKYGPHTDGNGIIIDDFNNSQTNLPRYNLPVLVEGNIVYNNGGEGIQVFQSDYVTVRNNTAYHNSLDKQSTSSWRAELSNTNSDHTNWINNIAVANTKVDKDNVALENTSSGGSKNVDVVWTNNITFNGKPGDDSVRASGGNSLPGGGNNKLGVDPKFVNAPSNFKLLPGSPALKDDIGAIGGSATSAASVAAADALVVAAEALDVDSAPALSLHGNSGANKLLGGAGNDKLYGNGGKDFLSGGDGSDLLRGGRSKDSLLGGEDNDVFTFRSTSEAGKGSQRDQIKDFSGSQDDKIDLSGIDANIKVSGNQGFSFVGSKAFSGDAGELRYKKGVVAGDVNGDKVADFHIDIANDHGLRADDFLL
jgi:serralysin